MEVPNTVQSTIERAHQVLELDGGDVYEGQWIDGKPDGEGKYKWADGSEYEGEWREGLKHGYGVYEWKSGSTYKGQWFEGRMQGYGIYRTADGAEYKGSWQNDGMHGLGRKVFANGDVYDGLWKNDKFSGMGRYIWKNGYEYNGEWLDGQMHNRGTFVFKNGNRYDGEWVKGKEHGRGLFTWADGGFYQGKWKNGKKHGHGVYYPAHVVRKRWRASSKIGPTQSEIQQNLQRNASDAEKNLSDIERKLSGVGWKDDDRERKANSAEKKTSDIEKKNGDTERETDDSFRTASDGDCEMTDSNWEASGSGKKRDTSHMNGSAEIEHHLDEDAERENKTGDLEGEGSKKAYVVHREYCMGELVSEETEELNGEKFKILGRQWGSHKEAYQAHQHRRKSSTILKKRVRKAAKKAGETIYQGHRYETTKSREDDGSYDLMTSLQLGIRWAVGKSSMPKTEIQESDFTEKEAIAFPREGSSLTPPHEAYDFKWKGYAPDVFKALRNIFKLDPADYMLSICGDNALRELPSPGKSGSVFFLSHDDKYLIKTMKKSEVKKLREILPAYYEHVKTYPETLLVKFFGLHRIKLYKGNKVRFVVMSNVVNTDLNLSERYDLKGSIYGRTARDKEGKVKDPETVTYKDLDLQVAFKMNPVSRQRIIRQIERDCKFLEQQDIMDYSLMLGAHIVDADHELEEPDYLNPEEIEPGLPREDDSIADLHKSMLRDLGVNGNIVPALEGSNHPGRESTDKVASSGFSTPRPKDKASADFQFPSSPPSIDSAYWQKPESIGINMSSIVVPTPDNAMQKGKGKGSSELTELTKEGTRREVRLFFGIIDILQEYSISKRVEANYYKFLRGNGSASAVDPRFYAKRFRDFMATVFVAE